MMANVRRVSHVGTRLTAAVLLLCGGCVQRELHVRSDPPGAAVWLNDREVGRTPFDREFLFYGNFDVVARADGYQTLKTSAQVTAPWWQWVPFDIITDFLPVRDDERIDLKLRPEPPPNPPGTLARAEELKRQLESSEHTVHRNVLVVPATRPASRPATEPADEGP